ncbi:MAG: hypothetical protein IJV71_12115 [Lachnospiraceae bacterium]|nr:hypothetical protein [Lachnospiraceae bacterium]
MDPVKINNTGSKREIKKRYNPITRQMEVIPADMRYTAEAYQRLKTPAFSAPIVPRRKGDTSGRKKTKG